MNLIHFIAVFCLSETWSLPIQPLQSKWSGNHLNQYSLNDNSTHFNPLGISELSSESYTNCGSHEKGLAADIIKANSKPDDVDVDEVYLSSEIHETRLPVSDIQEQTTETDTTENESTEEYTTEKVVTGKDSTEENQLINFLEYLRLLFNKTDSNDTGLSSLEVTNDLDTENIYRTKDHSSEDNDSNRQNDPEYGILEASKTENSDETAETSDISNEKDHYHAAASTIKKIIVSNGNSVKNEEKSEELNSASSQVDKDDGKEKTESNENVESSKKEETQQRSEKDNLENSNQKEELNSHHSVDNSEEKKNDFEIDSLVASKEKNSNELTESRDNSEQNDDLTENEEPVDSSKKEETSNSQHSAETSDEVTTSDYESMIKGNSAESAGMAKTSNPNYTSEEKVQYDIAVSTNVLLNEGDLGNNTQNEESYLNNKNMNEVSKTYDLSKEEESSRPENGNTASEHTNKTEELNSYYISEYPKEKTDLEINSLVISESSDQSTSLDENSGNESKQENSYSELKEKNSHEVNKEEDHYATAASTNVLNNAISSENDSTNNKEDLHEEQKFSSSQDDGESKANFDSPEEETPHESTEENSIEHYNRKEELNSYKSVETSQEKNNLETANSDIHQYDQYYSTSRTSHNTENQEKDLPDEYYSESSKNGYMDDTGKNEESTNVSSDLKEENSIVVVNTKDNSEENYHYDTAASSNVLIVHKGENEHKSASSQEANTNDDSLKEEQTQHGSEEGYNHYGITSHENDSTKRGDDQNKCANTHDKNKDDEDSLISGSEDGYVPYGTSCNDNDTTEDEDDQNTLSANSQDENSGYEDETRECKENVDSSNEEETQHGSEEGYHKSSSISIENTDDKDNQQSPSSQDENKDSKDEKIKSKENIDSLKEEEPQRSEEGNSIKYSNEKVEELNFDHFGNSQEKRDEFEIHSLVTSREMNVYSSSNNLQNDDPKSSKKENETPVDSSKEEQVSENSVEENDSTDDTEGTQHRFEEDTSNKNYNTNSENNNASISSEPINEGTSQKTQVHDSIETEESNSNHNDGKSHEKMDFQIVSKDSNHIETVASASKLNVAAITNTNDNNSEGSHNKQEISLDFLKEDNREKDYSHAASNNELVTVMYVAENKEIISDDTDSYQTTQELNTTEEIESWSPDELTVKENTEENKEGTSTEYTKEDFNENESVTEDETNEAESSGSFSFAIPRQNYFSFTFPDRRR